MAKKEGTSSKGVMTKAELEQALLNNFVNLQKVLTNLSVKFEELSRNISKLLELFEISAKSFAENYSGEGVGKGDKEFLKKLDSLLDQNKTIARGIMLMEEKIRHRSTPPPSPQPAFQQSPQQAEEGEESQFEGMSRSRPLPRY